MHHEPRSTGSAGHQPATSQQQMADKALISRMVHDLRGPLTSLQLGIELLMEVVTTKEERPILDQLMNDVERMTRQLEQASAEAKHGKPR